MDQTKNDDDFRTLEKVFPDKWQYVNKKSASPYEHFNCNDDYYQKPVYDLKRKHFFSKLKTKFPSVEEIKRTE